MSLKLRAALLALVSISSGSPIAEDSAVNPELQARDCLVNAQFVNLWVEDGLTRRSVHFSSEGLNQPDEFCQIWTMANSPIRRGYFNAQCWMASETQGQVDASWFRGPVGDAEAQGDLDAHIVWWQDLTGCATG